MMKGDHNDPKALIRESFNIEGITMRECRSIFLDWALSLPNEADAWKIIPLLLEQYGDKQEHPMLVTLRGYDKDSKPHKAWWEERSPYKLRKLIYLIHFATP